MSSPASALFTVSYDSAAKTISIAVCVMFLALGLSTASIAVGIVFALILAASFAWSPTGYSIEDGFLSAHRVIGNFRIPLASIREVRIAAKEDLQGTLRIFGSGGLFGYYGVFRSSNLGKSTWFMTRHSHAVVVVTSAGTYMFSPDDVDGFISWIRPAGSGPVARFAPVPAPSSRPAAAWIAAAIVASATTLAIGSLFYSPGLPEYTLTGSSLAIRDRFYPVTLGAKNVDLSRARVIDFASDPDWKPVKRTNGFSNAHYHSGFFRVASGAEVRMYRGDSTKVVLLPSTNGDDPVLLETREPAQFLNDLRQKWGNGTG
ncbi:MAG TPA: PH domain-containing protein [Bryobacteraceae bacterium]|nr:PH domain-containing protein [Bryobacteraceae bacterium]